MEQYIHVSSFSRHDIRIPRNGILRSKRRSGWLHTAFRASLFLRGRNSDDGYARILRTARDGKRNRLFDESLFIAGDESLVDLNLVVHYRTPNALTALVRARSNDELVRALAEASVREVLATETTDAVLTQEQPRILARVETRLREDFEALQLDLSLVDLLLTEARPPTAVTQAFRDVFSAREDQIKALQQAEARRNDAIPKARAESVVYISEATSFALDKRLRAEGDAERFRLESAAWKLSPEVTSYRLFIETVEKGLANRKKIVANPRANFGGYQLWLFGPQQAPFLKN